MHMKKILLAALGFHLSMMAAGQEKSIQKTKFHFDSPLQQDTSAGYAQAVKVGNIIYVSGTVSRDISPQGITQLYGTIQKTLAHYGASFKHVVKENLYTTDIEAMKKHNAARKQFYKGDFPAATWVQITRLYMEDAKLEVEVIAHLPVN
jgi:enamine deaminase RidA (YjgF/YER057c/UK114 family)